MRPGAASTASTTPAAATASCPFCARERQVCSTVETPFLVGETFSEHGTRDLTRIARCSLGYRARLVQAGRDGTNHALRTVNDAVSAWFSDRLQLLAAAHLKIAPPPFAVHNAPLMCTHHRNCYIESRIGKAVMVLENVLADLERYHVGSRHRGASAPFTMHESAPPAARTPPDYDASRFRILMQTAYLGLCRVYTFQAIELGELKQRFAAAIAAAPQQSLAVTARDSALL